MTIVEIIIPIFFERLCASLKNINTLLNKKNQCTSKLKQ